MTFKLPGKPSARADIHELADFAELQAWKNGSVSSREIVAFLGREGESDPNVGCEDIDDENTESLGQVMDEIERRTLACGAGYPYSLNQQGNVLRYHNDGSLQTLIYCYLLLSTRLNMQNSRVHANIDGTNLLEEVSAEILRSYLGRDRAKASVFGTAAGSADFPGKVTSLCRDLKEALGFRAIDPESPINANDDKLDVVGWIPFLDQKACQIIVFGQCKTGTAWTDQVSQLQVDTFITKWIDGHFLLKPLRALFISEAIYRARWGQIAAAAGLLFDRCRIVDCCNHIPIPLKNKVQQWNEAAFQFATHHL